MIDFSDLALAPEQSRAARNYLGYSQAQAATKAGLPVHKLKRFESGNYVPDSAFLDELRAFYEGEGFDFNDAESPGAKAKARGDVVPAGIVGKTASSIGKADGETEEKPARTLSKQLQLMRITPDLKGDQIDRILERIDENEAAVEAALDDQVSRGFLSEAPDAATQAKAITAIRRLAENGLLHARLLGRDPLAMDEREPGDGKHRVIGDLLASAFGDFDSAVVHGDKKAQARLKERREPQEVLEAIAG